MTAPRKVVGAATGPSEGWITVVCDDGSVFVGISCDPMLPFADRFETGKWFAAAPVPGTAAAKDLAVEKREQGEGSR